MLLVDYWVSVRAVSLAVPWVDCWAGSRAAKTVDRMAAPLVGRWVQHSVELKVVRRVDYWAAVKAARSAVP